MNKEEFNGIFFVFCVFLPLVSFSTSDSESSSENEMEENWYETGVPMNFISTGIVSTGNVPVQGSQEQAIEQSLSDNLSYGGHKKILDDLEDSVSQGNFVQSDSSASLPFSLSKIGMKDITHCFKKKRIKHPLTKLGTHLFFLALCPLFVFILNVVVLIKNQRMN